MQTFLKWLLSLVFGAWILSAASGCGNLFNQHAQLMDTMRGAIQEASARLSTSGTGQVQAGAHVTNPGIRVSAGVEYFAVARYDGVAGQIQASQQGTLDRNVSPEVQARIDRVYANTALSAAEKFAAAMQIIRDATAMPATSQPSE